MATQGSGWHYANVVNEQINPNTAKRNKWSNISNAVGNSNNYASASYTMKKTGKTKKGDPIFTSNFPYTVTAHDFRLNIPEKARITRIEIQASMKASTKNSGVEFPRGLMCIYGGGWSKHLDDTKAKETGWKGGLYFINPQKKMSSSKFTTYSYVMDEAICKKGNFTPSNLNATVCGIDLVFDDTVLTKAVDVYLRWVRIYVSYEIPEYSLVHDGAVTSEFNPRNTVTGKTNTVKFTLSNATDTDGGTRRLKLTSPYGTKINYVGVSKGSYDSNTGIWSVNCGRKSSAVMTIQYTDYTVDTQKIELASIENTIEDLKDGFNVSKSFYFASGYGSSDDYSKITTQLITPVPHYRHDCCFAVTSNAKSTVDNIITYQLYHSFNFEKLSVELDTNLSSKGVEITNYTQQGVITVTVPEIGVDYDICFRFCLRPLSTGEHTIYPRISGGTESLPCEIIIKPPYSYHFGNKTVFDEENNIANYLLHGETVRFGNHRIASELETGAYVLPCKVKDNDALMVQSKPNIHMYKWEQLDYIGCVPLEHLHFDPKSTYKDKLLDTHYKNKRYMGKELASDEDITLNVRLHPQQVTTVQGLIDMDKPIPINANHLCFEGDALNHRGWAEIYGITTTETNPHWYKCDIDVKYLTHNLNTRFKINKGDKTFGKYPTVTPLLESVASGESLSEDNTLPYFIVDTDGGYIYNEEDTEVTYYTNTDGKWVFYVEGESEELISKIKERYGEDNVDIRQLDDETEFQALVDEITTQGYTVISIDVGERIQVSDTNYSSDNQRNIFTLDEGQHFNIKSREILSNVAQVKLEWLSSKLIENKENAVSKIVRLVDKTTNVAMFEYEYSDFNFKIYNEGDNQIECHVIGRAYRKGDYDEVINEDIRIPVIVEDDGTDEDSEATSEETVEDITNEEYYGSSVSFYLDNNKLTIEDTGYTGKALSSTCELEGDGYYYEVEWKNNNTDGEDNDIITFINLTVQDSFLASQYSDKYSNMLVSPFPVADKTLLFSRNGEEGVLYYYDDDKEEFSYLIEPYYQYHNGVDLRASVDNTSYISIFNLNYGYKTVYLENGLVSLGINRLNGHMYLRKWDTTLKEYVTLFQLQLTNYDDININSISDDKIELQASNTLISMYRGHPYVIFKHELEDILIHNRFGRVWAEQVDDDVMQYPTYFDLMNTQNLLPACVGSKKEIDDDCVEVWECGDAEDCPDLTKVEMTIDYDNSIYMDEETNLSIDSEDLVNGDLIYYIIDGDVYDTPVTYPNPFPYTFASSKEYEVSAVYVGDETRSYAVAPTVTIYAKQHTPVDPTPEPPSPTPTPDCPQPTTGKYTLRFLNCPSTFRYRDNQEIKMQLLRGGKPVCGKTVERIVFKHTWSADTNKNGIVTFKNESTDTKPAKYKIGGRFFDYENNNTITKVFKDVTVKKADLEWEMRYEAGAVNKYASFKLKDKHTGRSIPNKKVTIKHNGVNLTKTTNEYGNVWIKVTKKGNHTYQCSFAGNSYYNKVKHTFKEKIR